MMAMLKDDDDDDDTDDVLVTAEYGNPANYFHSDNTLTSGGHHDGDDISLMVEPIADDDGSMVNMEIMMMQTLYAVEGNI